MDTVDIGIEPEALQFSAVLYLAEGKELEAAEALLYASVTGIEAGTPDQWSEASPVMIHCRGPRKTVEAITSTYNNNSYQQIRDAFNACLPPSMYLSDVTCKAVIHQPKKDWTASVLEVLGKGEVANQAVGANTSHTWQGFRFRSQVEIRVAMALDQQNVLFFPLPRARISIGNDRRNTEPDFLVCVNGKWGILEIDGAPYHPPERSAVEHERDRLFKAHGIRVVERYDANRAYHHVDEVVDEFLSMIARNG
ncbi:MAG TPA: hypothetical protein VNP95_02505 [Thermomicrobiales bacterium]|nr:hypothetical protein [Thermomicrobiales bacterium]